MASPISICSNALLMLGDGTINSFTDGTDRSKLCSNLYDQLTNWLLRSHAFSICKFRMQLAPDAVAPAFDYGARFLLPGDWLKTLQVGEIGIPETYVQEGRYILCDTDVLNLVYVRRAAEGDWDSMLVHTATLVMAAALAYPITQSAAMSAQQYQLLQAELRMARAVDGQDSPPETMGDFRLLAARYGARQPMGW